MPSLARHAGRRARWYGVFVGLVTDVRDPDGQGRVKVPLPWAPDAGRRLTRRGPGSRR